MSRRLCIVWRPPFLLLLLVSLEWGARAFSPATTTAPPRICAHRPRRLVTIPPRTAFRRSDSTPVDKGNRLLVSTATNDCYHHDGTAENDTKASSRRRRPLWCAPRRLWRRASGWISTAVRRAGLLLALSTLLWLGSGGPLAATAAAGSTGGRAGGTFSTRPTTPHTRLVSPRRPAYNRHCRSRYTPLPPPVVVWNSSGGTVAAVAQPIRPTAALLWGALLTALITYGRVQDRRRGPLGDNHSSPQDDGATLTALTLGWIIPNRYASTNDDDGGDSLVHRLAKLARRIDTSTPQGVQALLSEACLEMVRQQASLRYAWSDSQYHADATQALQAYAQRSVTLRSRYDRETLSNVNQPPKDGQALTNDKNDDVDPTKEGGRATMAVVSVHYVTQGREDDKGGSVGGRSISRSATRTTTAATDVVDLLRWVAATVPLRTLVAGEVVWSPQLSSSGRSGDDDTMILTQQDLDERYPELRPVL